MKIPICLLTCLLAALTPLLHAADSKRTADYLLISPTDYEGKEVTLDVAFVKPAHCKSPIPEIAFFHAMTIDRRDKRPGGEIIVAVPSEESEKFAKKYGTNFEGRTESNSLRGVFIATPGGQIHPKVWIVDTTGKAADLVKQKKLTLAVEEMNEAFGPGGPGPHHGPHHPARN